MFEVLKTENFSKLFSFVLGFVIPALLIPICKGDECFLKKAPSAKEMKESTFKVGSKCYQFKPEPVECPVKGAIESFQPIAYSH